MTPKLNETLRPLPGPPDMDEYSTLEAITYRQWLVGQLLPALVRNNVGNFCEPSEAVGGAVALADECIRQVGGGDRPAPPPHAETMIDLAEEAFPLGSTDARD